MNSASIRFVLRQAVIPVLSLVTVVASGCVAETDSADSLAEPVGAAASGLMGRPHPPTGREVEIGKEVELNDRVYLIEMIEQLGVRGVAVR